MDVDSRLYGSEIVALDAAEDVQGTPMGEYRGLSLRDETLLNTFGTLAGLIFCGIHVAAWNFTFPTHAEKIAWRVLTLTALAMVFLV
ncbi:hypothetical protein BDV12DRAFT_202069 [Aspergillus spectabilis]